MRFQLKSFALFGVLLILLGACKTSKPVRPMEYYDNEAFEVQTSQIQIPIKIDKNELEKSINEQLGDVIYQDNNMDDDDLMIRATKQEDIQISIDEDTLLYKVPLDLWIKKGLFLGDVEAEGELILDFKTQYQVASNWELKTLTVVSGYEWKKRPVLKLGLVDLPIKFIANKVLNRTKNMIETAIDDQVKNNLDLHVEINKAWQELHQPVLMSEEYKTWLLFNPKNISMTPLQLQEDTIVSVIVLKSQPQILLGEKPMMPSLSPLPNFEFIQWEEERKGEEDFALFLGTEVPFTEAERISKENMVGEVFSYGNKSVKVEDIGLYGQGKNLVINTLLSGSYNGNVYLIGKPKYNARKNQIELDDLKFEFSSQKFLLNSLTWLFKSRFKKELNESLNFYLSENLDEIKKMIQEEIDEYEVAKGITMRGNLNDLLISQVKIMKGIFKVEIALKGNVSVDVKGI